MYGQSCPSTLFSAITLPSTELPCYSADLELWFAESPAAAEAAKSLCLPCPLRDACLASALERREPWGVWGGELLDNGVVVPRKRPRGRPRKQDAASYAQAQAG